MSCGPFGALKPYIMARVCAGPVALHSWRKFSAHVACCTSGRGPATMHRKPIRTEYLQNQAREHAKMLASHKVDHAYPCCRCCHQVHLSTAFAKQTCRPQEWLRAVRSCCQGICTQLAQVSTPFFRKFECRTASTTVRFGQCVQIVLCQAHVFTSLWNLIMNLTLWIPHVIQTVQDSKQSVAIHAKTCEPKKPSQEHSQKSRNTARSARHTQDVAVDKPVLKSLIFYHRCA